MGRVLRTGVDALHARLVNNGLALNNGRRLPHLGLSTSTPITTTVHAMRVCCACGAWRSRPRDLGHGDRRMAEALCGGTGCSSRAHPALQVFARCALMKGDALHGETERTIGRLISSRGICWSFSSRKLTSPAGQDRLK